VCASVIRAFGHGFAFTPGGGFVGAASAAERLRGIGGIAAVVIGLLRFEARLVAPCARQLICAAFNILGQPYR